MTQTSQFQIEGMPGMMTQFQLFVTKSIMASCEELSEGRIFTVADLVKFFDKERLSDAVLSLHRSVDPKALRLWWLLSSRTTIRAQTGIGMTESAETGTVLAQGSSGGALASARTIDNACHEYFEEKDVYGNIRLQPSIFMDDVIRSSNNVINTNAGNMRLNRMVQELCLDIHPTKSCYLVIGSPNFKRRIQNEVEENPVMFGKILLKT